MFFVAAALFLVLLAAGAVYLVFRFHRFRFLRRLAERHRAWSWVIAFAIPAAIAAFFTLINVTSSVVVMLHLTVFWLVCDFAGFLVRKIGKKTCRFYFQGIAALLITTVYLGTGWFFAHHVFQTNYAFSTEKELGASSLRVAAIADAHLGITLKGADFARQMERLQQTNPDLVVVVGDFVDDDTEKQDMVEACRALGTLQTTYGVYFVFGNHDEGYFNTRDFSAQELRAELTKNQVTILEDESVLIDDRFYLIGREDRSFSGRQTAQALTADLDPSKYSILLDHQPNDYAAEAAAGVDLVLSGHTHGGHIFPVGPIGLAIGANDRVYGAEQRENTVFVVTSGISGWAIPFKTGAISEYVVIDITAP